MKIMGMVMRPLSMTEEENEKIWKSSQFYAESKFKEKYETNLAANQIIAESAKIYILKHYALVRDWSNLNIEIIDNSGKSTEYYNHNNEMGWRNTQSKRVKKMVERWKEKHNPIKTFTEVVLDPTDGDFSVTINGKDHLWIDDDSVIIIADFIEKLKNPELLNQK